MKVQHPLFSQVALAQDLPEHNLKRGDIATIVEHYPMPDEEEDGYSLEGFDLPHVTIRSRSFANYPYCSARARRNDFTQVTSALKIEAAAIGRLSRFSAP